MKLLLSTLLLFSTHVLVADSQASPSEIPPPGHGHVFGWPFVGWEQMMPRGGSTRGSEVERVSEARKAWEAVGEPDLDRHERDRRAILAMAGSYRVSFDFMETLGLSADHRPPRPYFSWGTEHVAVLEASEQFISLQHSLIMYFEKETGKIEGPFVMKHWRQDWTFEPETILTYTGPSTWSKIPAPSPQGRWSQAVWQVDDSPRYEVMGTWQHEGGLHSWRSDLAPRPLPRREFSVRGDYHILEGFHEITLSPKGWLHTQNNRKLQLKDDGAKSYLATELGISRYEAISSPELAEPFAEEWEKTAPYWKAVREVWTEIIRRHESFQLRTEVDGDSLWQHQFTQAAEYAERENPEPAETRKEINQLIEKFLITDLPADSPASNH